MDGTDEVEAPLEVRLDASLDDAMAAVRASSLSDDEARLVALARLARREPALRTDARQRGARLLAALADDDRGVVAGDGDGRERRSGAVSALVLAFAAAVTVQAARLVAGAPAVVPGWLVRGASLLVLPYLALLLARRRGLDPARTLRMLAPFALAALVVTLLPVPDDSSSQVLIATHLPVVLGLAALRPLVGGRTGVGADVGRVEARLAAVRFTGAWAVAFVLFALGGSVLLGLTSLLLAPFGETVIEQVILWVLPSGVAGAVIVAAWLVDADGRFTAAVAPTLALVFTPLFALMLAAAAVSYAVTGAFTRFDRETLVVFDALLVVVLALIAVGVASRTTGRSAALMARLRLVAVLAAVVLDGLVLTSMVGRVAGLGATPNRVAALGLNVILLVTLAGAAWSGARALVRGEDETRVARWVATSLPALGVWAAVVVVALPPIFGFA